MIDLLLVMGRSGSGKTTILEHIKSKGYKTLTEVTTRPKRWDGETGYDFLTEEEYMAEKDAFLTIKSYTTIEGVWRYGVRLPDEPRSYITIINPTQFDDIWAQRDRFASIRVCWVENDEGKRLENLKRREMMKRNPNIAELDRRLKADEKDFSEIVYRHIKLRIPAKDLMVLKNNYDDAVFAEIGKWK